MNFNAILKSPAVRKAIEKVLAEKEKSKRGSSDASDAKVAEIIKEQRTPAGYNRGGAVKKAKIAKKKTTKKC